MVKKIMANIENMLAVVGLTVIVVSLMLYLSNYFSDHCSTWLHKTICIFS